MLPPLLSLDVAVHAASLLTGGDCARLGCAGPALLVSTAHDVMLFDTRLHAEVETIDLNSSVRAGFRRLGGGYDMPAGVLLRPDSDSLLVADLHPGEHQFTLYAAHLHRPDRRYAQPLLRTSGQPLQLALHGSTLFYADHHRGALMAVDIDSASTLVPHEVLPRLESPVGVTIAEVGTDGGRQVLVSERRPGRVTSVQPELLPGRTQTHQLQLWQVERTGLHSPQLLSVDPIAGQLLLPQFANFGYVQGLELATGRLQTLLRLATHQRPLAAWRVGEWMLVAETGGIRAWNRAEGIAALRPAPDVVSRPAAAGTAAGAPPPPGPPSAAACVAAPLFRPGIPQPAPGL